MNYEKKYNEALERFKSFKEKYYTKDTTLGDVIFDKNGEMQKDFNGIFLELKESEDERIRQGLIRLMTVAGEAYLVSSTGIKKETYLAYLERQKECVSEDFESIWKTEDCKTLLDEGEKLSPRFKEMFKEVCHSWYDKGIEVGEKQKENPKSADSIPSDCVSDAKCEDRSPKHSDSDGTDIRDTPAYWKGWDDAMKQKEQKHPNGCFTCDEYKKGYESGRSNGFTAGYNKAMKEVEQKEQKPWKVGANAYFTPEQKPAEWSEEDKRTIDTIVSVLGQYIDYKTVSGTGSGYATPRYSKEIDFLKSLRPQKLDASKLENFDPVDVLNRIKTEWPMAWEKVVGKQEWGEEDERMRDRLITRLNWITYNTRTDGTSPNITFFDEIAWLKSLRPQPKRDGGDDYNKGYIKGRADTLKEFAGMSSWKPSEEQMEALLWCTAHLGGADRRVLAELYEHLKKLM